MSDNIPQTEVQKLHSEVIRRKSDVRMARGEWSTACHALDHRYKRDHCADLLQDLIEAEALYDEACRNWAVAAHAEYKQMEGG